MPLQRLRRSRLLPLALSASLAALALPAGAGATTGGATLQGKLQLLGGSDFVVQTAGRPRGVTRALIATANSVTASDYPYVWGGGHAQVGVPSVGSRGPGHNGRRRGYDCSGSVAAVLAGANLWPAGSSVPSDSGVISELRAWHTIARGAGHGPTQVTLYDDPGVHIFMSIDGRFFGTSAGGPAGDSRGGPGWLDGPAPDAFSPRYRRYHMVSSVLHDRVSGQSVAFRTGALQSLVSQFQVGEPIDVSYRATQYGTLVAAAVSYPGASPLAGTVTSVAVDGSSLTVQPASGPAVTLSGGTLAGLVAGTVLAGNSVSLTYSSAGGLDTLRTIVVSPPPAA
ncbi:MAG TPA: hypothetical protein VFP55_07325 [Solirubrobacteraceae bacterium]|nr:hypothetical protein [Solirubrobacteraceae bacterium]